MAQMTLALGPFLVTVIGVDGSNAAIAQNRTAIQLVVGEHGTGLTQIWPDPRAFEFTDRNTEMPISRFGPITEFVQLMQKTSRPI